MTAPSTTSAAPAASSSRAARSGGANAAAPRVVCAVHAQGANLHVVVARQDSLDAPPTIVEASTVPAGDSAGVTNLINRHKPSALLHLIPSSSTLARCTALPASLSSDRDQAAATLSLLAESEMPSMIPAHRRAAGIIRPGLDSAPEAVLIVGWPERAADAAPSLPVKDQSWTPELVALAALSRALGGSELALYADRQAGSIALVATSRPHHSGANGALNGSTPAARTVARVLRGDSGSDAAWSASVQSAVAESAASLSVAPAPIGASDALILLGSPLRRPRGAPADPNWLSTYGLAYGGVCALADSDPASRSLALLRAAAPREDASVVVRVVEHLANPRRAAIAIVCCLALLLLAPLGVAKARELILAGRAGGTAELDKRLRDAERRVAFYKQLREKRWPMTKLLADISGAAPVGVHVETISLSREQGVDIRGRAKDTGLITDFRSKLAACGVFGAVATPNQETDGDAFSFQLEADVVAPQYTPPRGDDKAIADFVKDPLAVRLYGDRARPGGSAPGSGPDAASSDKPASTATTTSDSPSRSGRSSGRGSVRPDSGASTHDEPASTSRRSASSSAIPEPLTDDDIAKMDHNTAMKEWATRKRAAGAAEDPAVKQRLTDEFNKCFARMQELKK